MAEALRQQSAKPNQQQQPQLDRAILEELEQLRTEKVQQQQESDFLINKAKKYDGVARQQQKRKSLL